jgi:hypothetical protein
VTSTCATHATLSLFIPGKRTREKQTRGGWHGWHGWQASKLPLTPTATPPRTHNAGEVPR